MRWQAKARVYRDSHYRESKRLARLHYWLGIPAVVLSAIVGTTVFAALQRSVGQGVQITVGAISVLTAIVTSIQTFTRFSERAESHRTASAGYDMLLRDIELLVATSGEGLPTEALTQCRDQLRDLFQRSPPLAGIGDDEAHTPPPPFRDDNPE